MAFRKKADRILEYDPDILIVPECEHPENLLFPPGTLKPQDILWFGRNKHKGLGIFSYGNFRFTVHDSYNPDFQLIIPILVTRNRHQFNLFAIWANNQQDKDGRYIEQVWKAVNHYDSLLTGKRTILIGDFNSNTIWDKEHKKHSHTGLVENLAEKGICSAYHLHHNQIQGSEKHPTLYMYRQKQRPYHIDYCFISADFVQKLKSVEIGDFKSWSKYSDHVPLIVTIKNF